MENKGNMIEALKTNIAKLKSMLEDERNHSNQLRIEVAELHKHLKIKEESFFQLETKYNTLKVARSLVTNTEDAHSAKLKVNTIVREIDKCIALLNR